jgi:hypothetical protein
MIHCVHIMEGFLARKDELPHLVEDVRIYLAGFINEEGDLGDDVSTGENSFVRGRMVERFLLMFFPGKTANIEIISNPYGDHTITQFATKRLVFF